MKVYLLNKEEREKIVGTEMYKNILDCFYRNNLKGVFCVGHLKKLVEKYNSFQEFRKGYFESGKKRLELLQSLDSLTRKANMEYDYYMKTGKIPYKAIYDYNSNYGRTPEELGDLANLLKEELENQGYDYSLENIYAVVYMNILQIPWNKKEA